MSRQELHNKIDILPNELLSKIAAFIDSLSKEPVKKDLSFDWAEDLKEYKSTFSSTELQHKASEWR